MNQLLVEASANDDSSIIALSMAKMEELQLFRGDTVLITGNNGHKTVCIVLDERYERCDDGSVRMNEVVRKNLRVRPGDIVTVSAMRLSTMSTSGTSTRSPVRTRMVVGCGGAEPTCTYQRQGVRI